MAMARMPPPRSERVTSHAYGETCGHCGRVNHFEAVCQSKDKPRIRQTTPSSSTAEHAESAVFDALCSAISSSQDQGAHVISLDHHLYYHLNDHWVRQASEHQPFITLTATMHPDDYTTLGFKPVTPQPKATQLSAMADTGCQSCLASMSVIRRLGLCENDLIPVTTCMHAANNNGIQILGAVILRFSGKSKPGQTLETQQIVNVTNDSDKLFLSRETCTALGMISGNFPTVGEALQQNTETKLNMLSDATGKTVSHTSEGAQSSPCNCPHRQTPPPKPIQPPFGC
ncbi:hypothetical protein QZH41_000673 [Actinostola sp. cb2023]|nr:hypothetical protein QZH41_000673 [Actinostola sp. cb2023]